MDLTDLAVWKKSQEAQGRLSIRELVKRATMIEEFVEHKIAVLATYVQPDAGAYPSSATAAPPLSADTGKLECYISTYIFARAILIELHVIISGPRIGVEKINEAISKAMEAWELRPSHVDLGILSWPFCVTASLATGPQRQFFSRVAVERDAASKRDALAGRLLLDPYSIVEKCWARLDERQASNLEQCYDWRECVQDSGREQSRS